MRWFCHTLVFICLVSSAQEGKPDLFTVDQGSVTFVSEAPLELISAESNDVKGLIRNEDRTFAFILNISSFYGFNSSLQREHFNEHYLESELFPTASFSGKIIEDLDLNIDGVYPVRAKGILDIHGVEQERIIKCEISVLAGKITARSSFIILLADHNISIPKIVYQKIAEEIAVDVEAKFVPEE